MSLKYQLYLKILWKMEHLLFWSKCSIFHNIFKSIQNLTLIFLEFFQCCLKIENDMGLDVRKPVFGGLQTTKAQTSLRIGAV